MEFVLIKFYCEMIDNKKKSGITRCSELTGFPLMHMNTYNLIFIKQSMSYHQSNLSNRIQNCVIFLNQILQQNNSTYIVEKLIPFQNKQSHLSTWIFLRRKHAERHDV